MRRSRRLDTEDNGRSGAGTDATNIVNLHNLITQHAHLAVSKPSHKGEEVAVSEFVRLVVLDFIEEFLGCCGESIVFVIRQGPGFFLYTILSQVTLR